MHIPLVKILGRLGDFSDLQPLPSLFIGGALIAVFLSLVLRRKTREEPGAPASLPWRLYQHLQTACWALFITGFLMAGLGSLRTYLHQTAAHFQRTHGRITEANLNAVQTIWGSEQMQPDLGLDIYYEEEVTERIESEDISKPAILRKKTVRHNSTFNPFLSEVHLVTLKQNARRKGSAMYGGYETECHFAWRLKNPEAREMKADIRFPLPADGAMYDALTATLDGQDVLDKFELKEGALLLPRTLKPSETFDLAISFKSRGMSVWYFQVREPREIRDFTLTLNLPDLPKERLNNPEGCMSPTDVKPGKDGRGSVLAYRLNHAISNKGMGVALPNPPQPGETTNAVLGEVEQSWVLIVALLLLGLTILEIRHAVLISLFFATATALGYGLLADFSDLLFGFWGTAAFLLAPAFIILAWLLKNLAPGVMGRLMALQLVVYGLLLPTLGGMDLERETLYQNLACGLLLAFLGWFFMRRSKAEGNAAAE